MRQSSLVLILIALVAINGVAPAVTLSADVPADLIGRTVNFSALKIFKDSDLAIMNEAVIFNCGFKMASDSHFKNNPPQMAIGAGKKLENIYLTRLFGFSESGCKIFDTTFISGKIDSKTFFTEPPTISRMNIENIIFICQKIS